MRTLVSLLTVGLLLAGCGQGGGSGASRSAIDVAEDDEATPAEIVAVGSAVDADASVGTTLVLYRVVGETGEVEQTAWRLYDADGETLDEGKGGTEVLGLDDGFWLGDDDLVRTDGSTGSLSVSPERLVPREGDVAVGYFEELLAIRSEPLTLFEPKPAPEGFVQGWSLDATGRQWSQTVEPEKVFVGTRAGWRQVADVPVEGKQQQLGFGLTPVGPWMVLPIVTPVDNERVTVEAFAVRRVAAPPAAPWTLIEVEPAVFEFSPTMFGVEDRYLVMADLLAAPILFDLQTSTVAPLRPPEPGTGWRFAPGHDGLYAFPPSKEAGAPWLSTDHGETWEQLAR